jgi:hypothetical protein
LRYRVALCQGKDNRFPTRVLDGQHAKRLTVEKKISTVQSRLHRTWAQMDISWSERRRLDLLARTRQQFPASHLKFRAKISFASSFHPAFGKTLAQVTGV